MKLEMGITLVLALMITIVTRKKNALTWAAVLTADAMLIFITYMCGLLPSIALLGMYLTVFLVDLLFGKKRECITKEVYGKSSTRGIYQVLANGAAGCICIFLYHFTKSNAWMVAYYASIFEVMADSIASDIGVLSKKPPRDICTWKEIPRGISGGVSALGMMASALACVIGGGIIGVSAEMKAVDIMIVIIVPFMGMIIDSVIGSKMQVKFICRVCGISTEQKTHCGKDTRQTGGWLRMCNGTVNFICTIVTAILGYILGVIA